MANCIFINKQTNNNNNKKRIRQFYDDIITKKKFLKTSSLNDTWNFRKKKLYKDEELILSMGHLHFYFVKI